MTSVRRALSASAPTSVLALILVLALVLSACSSVTDLFARESDDDGVAQPTPDDAPETDTPAAADEEPGEVEPVTAMAPQALQDLWMFTRIQTLDADGTTRDVVVEVLEALEEYAGEPVELADGLVFREVPELQPMMVRADGTQRADVDMVAGLFELTEDSPEGIIDDGVGATLGVVGSAGTDVVHISPGDLLSVDLFDLAPLADAATALVDYVFGQTLPPEDGEEEVAGDPIELLAERFAAERVTYGTPDEDSEDLAVFSGIPMQRVWHGQELPQLDTEVDTDETVQSSATAPGADTVSPALYTADEAPTLLQTQGGAGGGGLIPVKARGPIAGAVASALVCIGVAVLAGPAGGVVVTVVCTALGAYGIPSLINDLLDDNNDPDPPNRPCVGSCTRSWGDPHVVGFTGLRYDVHAVGEFTAVQGGQVHVQVRTIPVGARLAANGAIAAQVADSRITIEPGREQVLWIDGQPAELDEFEQRDLPGGGSLARHGSAFDVRWPDGSQLWVDDRATILDYELAIGTDNVEVDGLHGTLDGQRVFPDGAVLEDDPDHDTFYGFVDAWRITDATSLFDYAEGTSTETYTDLDFPPGPAGRADFDADTLAWAEAICTAAGIAGDTLQDCILDVAGTGDTTFAWSALEQQAIVEPDLFESTYDLPERDEDAGQDTAFELGNETDVGEIAWSKDARDLANEFEGESDEARGDVFSLFCPALPADELPLGTRYALWGTDLYSDDSTVCAAAAHMGLINPQEGGSVRLALRPGADEYEASERNGVTSRSWSSWGGSFVFIDRTGRVLTGQ